MIVIYKVNDDLFIYIDACSWYVISVHGIEKCVYIYVCVCIQYLGCEMF